jgi:hypothetical protein
MFPGLGASLFAIHSNRQESCAVNEHGHGVRQSKVSGVSSVSSCWQIQQVRTSRTVLEGFWSVIVAGRDMGRKAGREGLLRSKGSGICSELEGMLEEDSRAE